jgi:hypothetical protein
MRYMMLVYTKEDVGLTPEETGQLASAHRALMDETGKLGILEAAEPLARTATAKTVRHKEGQLMVTDGPFAETKEQLAGYYILECKDLDEAIQWASKIPTECGGGQGSIEIRPFRYPN